MPLALYTFAVLRTPFLSGHPSTVRFRRAAAAVRRELSKVPGCLEYAVVLENLLDTHPTGQTLGCGHMSYADVSRFVRYLESPRSPTLVFRE